jgi:[ribosomal protein S5]-alanine N-acetyltransferase
VTLIRTERLDLIPGTAGLLRAELQGREALARRLGLEVPATWPPELFDRPAVEWTLARLEEDPGSAGWWLHYFVHRASGRVVGCGGYKGPPVEGAVEIGYSILEEHRRRGFATEATLGLVARAFEQEEVGRVVTETLPELGASIRVLERAGFRLVGEGSDPGTIRFEISRLAWEEARPGSDTTSPSPSPVGEAG